MKRKLTIFIVCILIMSLANLAEALYTNCPGIIHLHSTYSDGDRTPGMVKFALSGLNILFAVQTDHIEQIDKVSARKKATGSFAGFDRYLSDFSTNSGPILVAGCEVIVGKSHCLVLGKKQQMREFFTAYHRGKTLSESIALAKSFDLLTIAAHPNSKNYPFDTIQGKDVDGIEVLNETYAQYQKTRDWYLGGLKEGKIRFVTAGCDSHTSVDPTSYDKNRWTHITWLNDVQPLSGGQVLLALRQKLSFACSDGISMREGTAFLSFTGNQTYTQSEYPAFYLYLDFQKALSKPKIARMYENGELMKKSEKEIPKGTKKYNYTFFPEGKIAPGTRTFVFEVDGMMITSPLIFNVTY